MNKLAQLAIKIRNRFQKPEMHIPRQTVSYEKAKNIGILFLAEEKEAQKAINKFVVDLQKEGKNLQMLTFIEKITNNPYYFSYHTITNNDVSNLGKINSLDVEHFINIRFDYLYCIVAEPFPLYDGIMQKSQAKCRIGRYFDGQEENYELMISLDKEAGIEQFIEEMMVFMRGLKAT